MIDFKLKIRAIDNLDLSSFLIYSSVCAHIRNASPSCKFLPRCSCRQKCLPQNCIKLNLLDARDFEPSEYGDRRQEREFGEGFKKCNLVLIVVDVPPVSDQ
jgi:hypothetical protein